MSDVFTFRTATFADLPFIDHLQAQFTDAVGWLSTTAIRNYIYSHVVILGLENDEPAGYLLGTRNVTKMPGNAAIYQAAISYDARRHHLGSMMVDAFVAALPPTSYAMHLWCAQDLEANLFWQSQSFDAVRYREGSKQKGRLVIMWRRIFDEVAAAAGVELPTLVVPGMTRSPRVVHAFSDGQTWNTVNLSDAFSEKIVVPVRSLVAPVKDNGQRVRANPIPTPIRHTLRPLPPTAYDPAIHVLVIKNGRVVHQPRQ